MFYWTAEPMTAQGPRKGEPSPSSMRNGLRPQPARSVRGSSRRIMSMRFRPANIRVINRRASSSAVIGPAVQTECSRLTSGSVFPLRRPSKYVWAPERCSPARVRFATPDNGVPLPAPRRSGQAMVRRAAPAGTLHGSVQGTGRLPSLRRRAGPNKKRFVGGLTGSLHTRTGTSGRTELAADCSPAPK